MLLQQLVWFTWLHSVYISLTENTWSLQLLHIDNTSDNFLHTVYALYVTDMFLLMLRSFNPDHF